MAVTADPVRGNVRLKYEGLDETTWTYSVAKLDPAATAENFLLIAEAVADLQHIGLALKDIQVWL